MGEIMPRAHLQSIGWSSNRITKAVRDHELIRPAPGSYVEAEPRGEEELYRLKVIATMRRRSGAASHQSAAALHDIPYFEPDRSRVHVTVDRSHGGGVRGKVFLHSRPLPIEDVTQVGGVIVTSRARTAVDGALTGNLVRAVIGFDAVRRVRRFPRPDDPEPISVDEITACLTRLGGRRGTDVARRGLTLSVDKSESAGESWARMQMLAWGIPAPELQRGYTLGASTYYADFTFGDALIGEFDGKGKYGETDAEKAEALEREKARQVAFEKAGFEVIRFGWPVLTRTGALRALLAPALRRHGLLYAG
ncbi:type IV toxin-antitoxin system AbiEi family antitoxin domain-containing protein [Tsukamurella pulmonis]|uniref:type IV toxin-antitoxin system AbiEi family antitoxin domain-containing protein n=1 Tax=Tsukamurella pulmonis TaxID=47312 RepID=UPI000838732F|nr:hypothetical protein [Tsukamurella pulmonis]RDH11196.1 hypothetical protein DVB88_13935 [Tsukamurella pulmonis]